MTDPWEAQREALGAFIREQRKRANLSLRQLAELTSLSNPYLSQVERGLHQPSVRVLKALSGALNVSAETLLAQAGLIDAMVPSEIKDEVAEAATGEEYANETLAAESTNFENGSSAAVFATPSTVTTVPEESPPIPDWSKLTWY